jgi:RNA polymerase sigma-70 factor (ECF subfamily)
VIADDDLMRELKGGSNAALEMLFERYRAAVWQFFRRRLSDPARAEELAQEVFVVLMRNAARYEPRASFRSYLFGSRSTCCLPNAGKLRGDEPSHSTRNPLRPWR